METKNVMQGFAIIICDRGYVYVGDYTIDESFCVIKNAKNIRKWGTTKGLGELKDGPLHGTVLDDFGTVRVPMRAIISVIDAEAKKWSA